MKPGTAAAEDAVVNCAAGDFNLGFTVHLACMGGVNQFVTRIGNGIVALAAAIHVATQHARA